MDMSRIEKIDDTRWTVLMGPGEHRAPVILFGTESLLLAMDDKVLEQILNTSRLPGLEGSAMTMPDAHWGYGFPIGGVAAFDAERGGVVSAGGVGFDISCGIRTLRSNLSVDTASPDFERLADELFFRIPAGVGEGGETVLFPGEIRQVMEGGAVWAVREGYGIPEDLEFIEEKGRMGGARSRIMCRIRRSSASRVKWELWGPEIIIWRSRASSAFMIPRSPGPSEFSPDRY